MSIQSLSRACQHQISLAQAVLDTAAALKELVENALDAGATQIDVNIKGPSALNLLQVADNGSGIDARDFENVCKPSYTSKLQTLEQLGSVRTLGFRGEALASLCLLGNVQLLTKTAQATTGSCLSFDHSGNVTRIEKVARERGTTVIVTNLFDAFPVRKSSLQKATKRETTRLLDLIQQFALVCPGVRFSLSIDGKRTLKTQGHGSCLDVIAQLFSSRTVSCLIPIDTNPTQDSFARVTGYVSKADKSCARSAADRQYVFFRSRPIEMRKLCSLITKIYQKQVGQHSYPLLFLHLELEDGTFDINIAADKRQLFIHEASTFLEACTQYFCELYKVKDYLFILPECSKPVEKMDSKWKEQQEEIRSSSIRMQVDCFRRAVFDESNNINNVSSLSTCNALQGIDRKSKSNHMVSCKRWNKGGNDLLEYAKRKRRESVDACSSLDHNDRIGTNTSEQISQVHPLEEPKEQHEKLVATTSTTSRATRNSLCFLHSLSAATPNKENTTSMTPQPESTDPIAAEMELRQVLHKDDFLSMQVIGQFNQGFIIVKWHGHLFIVDQHAADERYHFESLHKSQGELPCQPYVQPFTMHLSAEEEWLLLNHLDWIESWGFRFSVDMEKMPGNRVCLVQVPFHDKATFGVDDVLEMIHQLRTGEAVNQQHIRFPRLEAAFASQACRMSVMIGTPLDRSHMSSIVQRLATLKDPWRCPHGRPTIRHLFTTANYRSYPYRHPSIADNYAFERKSDSENCDNPTLS